MFYFLHSQQDQSNYRYYKGLLLEELLRSFLAKHGYDVALTRRKHNSLEYDIEGTHKLDKRIVSGEAKAHEDTIAGEMVAAFVGKLMPLHYQHHGAVTGLFLSTSSLSPDAEDFVDNIKRTTPLRIERYVGIVLEQAIRTALGFPAQTDQTQASSAYLKTINASHLLHTDQGTFLLLMGVGIESGNRQFADQFAAISTGGQIVQETEFLRRIRDALEPLRELEPSYGTRSLAARPDVPLGLITSSDWMDFRHPAAPEFFIGRQQPLDTFARALAVSTGGLVVEVKSRSGVGKSSLLAAMADRWRKPNCFIELHDARDVHSSVDVLSLARRFFAFPKPIADLESLASVVEAYTGSGDTWSLFIADQFESCFQLPEVFRAYEYLAMCIARSKAKIAFVFARKDDLLTTHDDVAVSLDRLRNLAITIQLDDFSRVEAIDLVQRIATILPKKLNPNILSQVLEFAQGFPWLLRRTMTHVVKILQRNGSQQALVSSGLHLADLFQEELDELDEVERGYLVRIAAALPATYHSLLHRFEGDQLVPRMLEKLTGRRVLRFSAGTYDTYNDVFKDYLLYDRMPERSQSALHKIGPVPVMKAFRALKGASVIDIAKFGKALNRSIGSTYNTLRELRLAGLVARKQDEWIVPSVVREYEFQTRLGEYVRQALIKNGAVHDFMRVLEKGNVLSFFDTASFLKKHFPFVQAADHIWESYARTFWLWLQMLSFIEINSEMASALEQTDELLERLGNLNLRGRGLRPKNMPFVPSRELSVLQRVLGLVARTAKRPSELSRTENVALNDLARLGAIDSHADGTHTAKIPWHELERSIESRLRKPPYLKFWASLKRGIPTTEALGKMLGEHGLADSTLHSHAEKLTSWGKTLKIIPRRRYVHV